MGPTPHLAAVALLGMLLPAAQPVTPVVQATSGQVPFPGGIADLAGRTAYLSNPHGGIDAVDLTTGDLLWDTSEAQRPLLLVGDRLYAQAGVKRNRLRILSFDLTHRGECVLESDPLVLPDWVVAGDAPGHSFQARWRLDRHFLALDWKARSWHTSPRATPEQQRTARREAAGKARFDLKAGRVETGPPDLTPAPTLGFPPVDKIALRWHGVARGHRVALVLEDVVVPPSAPPAGAKPGETAAPIPIKTEREQSLVLRSWDRITGQLLRTETLMKGKRLLVKTTLDELYLFLRDSPPSPDMRRANDAPWHSWEVFEVATAKRVARISFTPGTEAVSILGMRVYALVGGPLRGPLDRPGVRPRTLQARDLKTGEVVWQRPVAGKVFDVPPPLPPAPPKAAPPGPAKAAPSPAAGKVPVPARGGPH